MNRESPGTLGIIVRYITGGPRAVFDPKWKSGCIRSAGWLVGILLVIFVIIILLQAAFTPWGRSLTGAPTLTGRWYGETARPPGQAKPVYVKIEGLIWGADEGGCLRNCDVQGIVRVCIAPSVIQNYTFYGDVSNRSGRNFRIDMRKVEDRAYGWKIYELKGAWLGGDTLRLAGEWITDPPRRDIRIVTDSAGNTVMDPAPEPERRAPVTFALRRGRERDFLAACKDLKPGD